jgi:Cohesin loading factor
MHLRSTSVNELVIPWYTIVTKIDVCGQNRMLDLKYSMQHLLARMLYKSNPKAALKAVDGMIQDVEAYVCFNILLVRILTIAGTVMWHGSIHSVSCGLIYL